ncbi:MAG: DUF6797 domain-containing protein [Planctomycetota bacterium]
MLPLRHFISITCIFFALTGVTQAGEPKPTPAPKPQQEAQGNWLTGTIYAGSTPMKEADVKKMNMTDDGVKGLKLFGGVTLKGLVIRLGEKKDAAVCFDTELMRMSAGWTGGFVTPIKLMSRGEFPTALGTPFFWTNVCTYWAKDEKFCDPLPNHIGPLPKDCAEWKGFYVNGEKIILSYTVEGVGIYEMPEHDSETKVFYRKFTVAPSSKNLKLAVPTCALGSDFANVSTAVSNSRCKLEKKKLEMAYFITIPASNEPTSFRVALYLASKKDVVLPSIQKAFAEPEIDLKPLTHGGPAHWPEVIETKGVLGTGDGAYVVDTLTVPYKNPYNSEMLISGMDFFSDGRAAVCTFGGDVWIVSGIDDKLEHLKWKRFASGLYHPLGLKIVKDEIYTLGRDQVTRLHDLNGDGEADFYENFNNDIHITTNFHEFAFDLQTDPQGNFYFSKAGPVRNGGRGFQEIVDHHGCLLKLTPDGKTLSVVATGFRAPNGIGVGPNGELSSGDNEGTWMPMCRLNWIKPGGFYGAVPTAHRTAPPSDYDKPICWFPKDVDNSSGCQVWDTTGGKFGPFAGGMFHLSYGTCSLFHVMKEEVDGVMQGGVVRLPLNFNHGTMRARFNTKDNAMYICGLKGWQTTSAEVGGLQRVRYTGKPANLPSELHVVKNGIKITFTDPLDRDSVKDLENYTIEQWNYIWSEAYGSPDISAKKASAAKSGEKNEWTPAQMSKRERDTVVVKSVTLLEDNKTLYLEIPEIQPVMQMKIKYNIKSADGKTLKQEIINTIHALGGR